MRIFYFSILIFILSLVSLQTKSQINRGSARGWDTTAYNVGGVVDSIFIFNVDDSDPYVEAVSPDGSDRTFTWYRYNPATDDYELDFTNNGSSSQVTISEPVGYRVNISGDTDYWFWALVNDFNVSIISTDEDKKIRDVDVLCGSIYQILAEIEESEMYYYDRNTHEQIQYPVDYQVNSNDWYPNPDPDFTMNNIQQQDMTGLRVTVEKPYWEDTWYIIEVEDDYELIRKDSAFHESSQPHAYFSEPEHIPLDDPVYYPDKSERYYDEIYNTEIYGDETRSAPAIFLFTNESVNADESIWDFKDSTIVKTEEETVEHTYQYPGTYQPILIVSTQLPYSIDPCIDTFPGYDDAISEPVVVEVDPPSVNIGDDFGEWPNVFNPPNGDIKYFRFIGDVSITNFEIKIYNRYGKKVYEYQGNVRDWDGWNGRKNGSGKVVSTGVYYYVIKEMYELPVFNPIEDEPYQGIDPALKNEIVRGFFHVYNTE